jgi:hypothetical protein
MTAPQIYIWANRQVVLAQPGDQILHAGGLQYCIETVEELAVLEHDAMIRTSLDGVFMRTPSGEERIADPILHISDRLIQDGITENWFKEGAAFGNGVSCVVEKANFETKLVQHQTGRTLDDVLREEGYLDFSRLRLYSVHDRTEGWEVYERRWRSGTCPQYSHHTHLCWMVVKHELRGYGYRRIQELVEEGTKPKYPELYMVPQEPGKYLSTVRLGSKEPSKEAKELLKGIGGLKWLSKQR